MGSTPYLLLRPFPNSQLQSVQSATEAACSQSRMQMYSMAYISTLRSTFCNVQLLPPGVPAMLQSGQPRGQLAVSNQACRGLYEPQGQTDFC